MVLLLVLLVTLSVTQNISADDCFQVLSTKILTRHINYTGNACKWKIIVPESQRIVLNLQKFAVEKPDAVCTVYLNVYDEESAATPICPGFDGSIDYVSEGNTMHLNVTNLSGRPVTASLEATFRSAERYFSCGFNTAADCTGQVAEKSSWRYSTSGNDVCAGLTTGQGPRSGMFYQAAYSSDSLRLSTLLPGRYVFDAKIISTCSMPDFRQNIFLTFCNITRRYSLQDFYFDWSTFLEFVECNTDFEVTMYASPGAMVVAMDNIRLMKIIDEIHTESTVPPFTTDSMITAYYTESSGLQQRRILMCVCSAIIFLLVAIGVGCILVYKGRHRVNELSQTQPKVTFDNRTYDHNTYAQPASVMPLQNDAVCNNGYSMINESEYQAVNGTSTLEDYHHINDVTHLGYESMLPGVQGQDKNLSVNTHSSENSAKPEFEDGTYYISTGNEYQVMNQPVSLSF